MTGDPVTIAIVGATASGKSAVALEVAGRIGGEIISMDSRQVYRGMDIGTAKPTAEERGRVLHHGLDLIDPGERFNAGRFADCARALIEQIQRRGATPMLVGGTGFFLRALTNPIFEEPPLDPVRRAALETHLATYDDEVLRLWVRALDPVSGERLRSWGGRQRLLRALELPLLTGRALTWWHANAPARHPPLRALTCNLELPWPVLEERIDRRIDLMLAAGLVDELASLLQKGFDERSPGLSATGYIELIPHLRGETTLEEAVAAIRRNTRAYARRQLTWFRNQLPEGAVTLDGTISVGDLADEVIRRFGPFSRTEER